MPIPVNTQSGMDAMAQMAQVGQAASSSAANFARAENTYADTNLKYAELQQKFQDISQRDMELEVMGAEQQGKLANAEVFTQRNINMLQNVDKLTKADATNASNAVIEAQMKFDDNQRLTLGKLADSVKDPQSHARAYEGASKLLREIGSTPEEFGISRQWEGTEETANQWMFNKNAAIASQELMGKQRLASDQYKRQVERDQTLEGYNIEASAKKYAFTAWQADLDRNAALEQSRARSAMSSKLPVKRSDVDTMTTTELQNSATYAVSRFTQRGEWSNLDMSDEKVQRYANEVAVKANELVDNSIVEYNTTGKGRVIGPAEALRIETANFLERTDNDGNVSTKKPRSMDELVRTRGGKSDIDKAKFSWASAWISDLLKNDPRAKSKTETQLNGYADKAWKDQNRRFD